MKRFSLFLLSFILLLAAVMPGLATAEDAYTLEADSVLIYNPYPYDANGNKLYTGTLKQFVPDEEPSGKPGFTPGPHKTGKDRSAATKDPDTHDFWIITNLNTYTYDKVTFRLVGGSEHCSIWQPVTEGALVFSGEQIEAMATQFETVIYASDTERFGPFRDLGGDGKLNIVTYDMRSYSVCGFFDAYDLYSAEEIAVIDPDDAESYNCLPIINVNTRMTDAATICCTLAHEFQHLIHQSAMLASPANADRIGKELKTGVWLNEAFSMEAEDLAYPGSVEQQGYLSSYHSSQKVMLGMSLYNFDATGSDIGAYGQSYLFAEYLKTQCGTDAFSAVLDYWRNTADPSALTEAQAIRSLLSDEQIAAFEAQATFTASTQKALKTDADVLLSGINLAYRLAILLQRDEGIYSIGDVQPSMPVYEGSGRRIEGGGAILLETNGSFSVPKDADSGLVFIGISDGAITAIFTVPEPREGNYVLAACFEGQWYAIPAAPAEGGVIRPVMVPAPVDGCYSLRVAEHLTFTVTQEGDGYRIRCSDPNGAYALTRQASNQQNLSIEEGDGTLFRWTHFADGSDRLQADGYAGRAILYGYYQKGFAYFAPAYFDNASFAKLQLIPIRTKRCDANLDGKLTAADAAQILRCVVGYAELTEERLYASDANGDGTVTADDAAMLLQIVLGLTPVPEED